MKAPVLIRIVVKHPLRVFVVARLVFLDRESRRREAVYWQRVPEAAWLTRHWPTLQQLAAVTARAARADAVSP